MTVQPEFLSERRAAQLLDMTSAEFRERVYSGALPPPVEIAGLRRWDRAALLAVVRGEARRAVVEDLEA